MQGMPSTALRLQTLRNTSAKNPSIGESSQSSSKVQKQLVMLHALPRSDSAPIFRTSSARSRSRVSGRTNSKP